VPNEETYWRELQESKKQDLDDDGCHAELAKHLARSEYPDALPLCRTRQTVRNWKKLTADS
jgi:hypothetical protein